MMTVAHCTHSFTTIPVHSFALSRLLFSGHSMANPLPAASYEEKWAAFVQRTELFMSTVPMPPPSPYPPPAWLAALDEPSYAEVVEADRAGIILPFEQGEGSPFGQSAADDVTCMPDLPAFHPTGPSLSFLLQGVVCHLLPSSKVGCGLLVVPLGLCLHLYSWFGFFFLLSSLSPGAEKHNDCRFLGGSKVTRSRATKRHEKW